MEVVRSKEGCFWEVPPPPASVCSPPRSPKGDLIQVPSH